MDDRERRRRLAANAESYARVALANIQREYPVAESYFITGPGPLPMPRERHPAFFGSLDWHSCVEMHWVLVRLLRLFPDLEIAAETRAVLDDHFAADKLAREAAYFRERPSFERPYGWGWLLMLAHELDVAVERTWSRAIAPLAEIIADGFLSWLPKVTYPQRTGLHGNTAFALLLAHPFAQSQAAAGRPALVRAIEDAAERWYAGDTDYPARFEPSGSDFLSPALTEAALMSLVSDSQRFWHWFEAFLPKLPTSLLNPAVVSDPTDGQIAHLHGLNLSRAYCLQMITPAEADRDELDPASDAMRASIVRHAEASLPFVVGSDYMVEHWLAAYALLLLS